MIDQKALCEKITSIYPDIGSCGIDVDVKFNKKKGTWIVHLKRGAHELEHHLELPDADKCMDGKECVSLGLEIAQLKKNIAGEQF